MQLRPRQSLISFLRDTAPSARTRREAGPAGAAGVGSQSSTGAPKERRGDDGDAHNGLVGGGQLCTYEPGASAKLTVFWQQLRERARAQAAQVPAGAAASREQVAPPVARRHAPEADIVIRRRPAAARHEAEPPAAAEAADAKSTVAPHSLNGAIGTARRPLKRPAASMTEEAPSEESPSPAAVPPVRSPAKARARRATAAKKAAEPEGLGIGLELAKLPRREGPMRTKRMRALLDMHSFGAERDLLAHGGEAGGSTSFTNVATATSPPSFDFFGSLHTGLTPSVPRRQSKAAESSLALVPAEEAAVNGRRRSQRGSSAADKGPTGGARGPGGAKRPLSTAWTPLGLDGFISDARARRRQPVVVPIGRAANAGKRGGGTRGAGGKSAGDGRSLLPEVGVGLRHGLDQLRKLEASMTAEAAVGEEDDDAEAPVACIPTSELQDEG